MENLFQQTDIELQRMHFYFQELERCSDESQAQPIFQTIAKQMQNLNQNIEDLDRFVSREAASKKRAARYRFEQLQRDYNSLDAALTHIQSKLTTKWRSTAEREELLTRRYRPNDTQIDFEGAELQMNDGLHRSHNAIDEMIAQGGAVLDSLRSQHVNLRGVRRKIVDITQTLGLSDQTLRMIERRLKDDWQLFLVLCVLSLIFMYAFYRYWTG